MKNVNFNVVFTRHEKVVDAYRLDQNPKEIAFLSYGSFSSLVSLSVMRMLTFLQNEVNLNLIQCAVLLVCFCHSSTLRTCLVHWENVAADS